MKPAKNLADLKQRLVDTQSVVAGDTKFTAIGILFLAEQQERLVGLHLRQILASTDLAHAAAALVRAVERRSTKRQPTAWQRYFGDGMKAGKTAAEIGAQWTAQKA